MANVMINPTSNITAPTHLMDEEKGPDYEREREERKATGRTIAIVIFLSLMCLAIYQVIQRKTTILAGVLVPGLILFTYTFFVIHISKKDKKKRKQLESSVNNIELSSQILSSNQPPTTKKIPNVASVTSISSHPSTSTSPLNKTQYKNVIKSESMRLAAKTPLEPTMNSGKTKKAPPPFKKTPSQSHIQVKMNQSAAQFLLEIETKKLKKSRSFDRHSTHLEIHRKVDNKKIKTKI